MAETRLRFDAVVKDLFQGDLPTLLAQLAGPAEVREFLNVEFSVVEERVADLVLLLSDGSAGFVTGEDLCTARGFEAVMDLLLRLGPLGMKVNEIGFVLDYGDRAGQSPGAHGG